MAHNMAQFLKLSTRVINVSRITHIEAVNNIYNIHIVNNKIEGVGSAIFASIRTEDDNIITICKDTDPQDYISIKGWIDKIDS